MIRGALYGYVMACVTATGCTTSPKPARHTAPEITRLAVASKRGALAPYLAQGNGRLYLTWLEPHDQGGHALQLSVLGVDGFSPPSTIIHGKEVLANWADTPTLGVAADGSLTAYWPQTSRVGEFVYDAMLARSTDDGRTWKPLGALNDSKVPAEYGFVSWAREGMFLRAFWLDGRDSGEHEGTMSLRTAW